MNDAPASARQSQAIAQEQQERAMAHQRAAARTLVAFAVEAGEAPQRRAAAGTFDRRSRARDGGEAQVRAPDRLLVPRRDRGLQSRNRSHGLMMAAFGSFNKDSAESRRARRRSTTLARVRAARLGFLVLCYHSVSKIWPHALSVTPDAFQRQVTSIARTGLPPLTAEALADRARRGVHVTFDDAYRDVLGVLPLLEELGLPTTVFVSTAYADDGRSLAVPELAADAEARPEALATMNWDELRELAERGVEIGSHTVNHPHLTLLSDDELDRELSDSRTRIEDELRRPARLLAYPYGEHDARVQAAVKRAGYAAAFAQWPGSSIRNDYALPRVSFYRGDSLRRAMFKTTKLGPSLASLRERVGR